MADTRLRKVEREARFGGPEAEARKLQEQLRTGVLTPEVVRWAAHLGDNIARMVIEDSRIVVECPQCRSLRERQYRRNRDPQPTPLQESPRQCFKCGGSERVLLDRGLVRFVRQVEDVPHKTLVAWATDCAERQVVHLSLPNPRAYSGRLRLPSQPVRDPSLEREIIPAVRRWLVQGFVDPLLHQRAHSSSSVHTNLGTPAALATCVVLANSGTESRKVRWRAAQVASEAYVVAGRTRAEREWQEKRLVDYLLKRVDHQHEN